MSSESIPAPWAGVPAGAPGDSGRRHAWVGWLAAACCAAIVVTMIVFQERYRVGETWLASEVVSGVLGQHTFPLPGRPVMYFQTSASPGIMGIIVSLACSSVLLVAPLFAISGAMFLSTARSRGRVVLATLVAFVIIAVANNIRLTLIVALAGRFGKTGLDWGHVLIGSLVMLAAGGAAILVYLRIMTGHRPRRRRKEEAVEG
ncbi:MULTISPECIES: exosortase/archaeosortase family protein [Amycolatopsis]|uniref:Exosortase/archaeosortase family protein n=2 Tax=Amycolatopsis TaxID=1813 RepID=A0A1I3Q7R2_9PSEU|nr:exosortase/archaeosortase family protein [Amycolatopsis sacchari]SFJ29695.1 exosortase/archaeosortase family protein [Amycolatopsis sacchari]